MLSADRGAARALPLQAAEPTEMENWASCQYGKSKLQNGEHTLPIYEETCAGRLKRRPLPGLGTACLPRERGDL